MAVLLVIGLGFVAYSNCLDNPLIIDDRILIEDDARVQEGRYLELVTGEYWPGARGNQLYRPLTSLSLALSWASSPQPRGLRLPNLLLHIASGLLVLLLARRLSGSLAGGVAAAALFVVHPVHSNVLNSVVDRAEIGATFFGLLTLLLVWPPARALVEGRRDQARRGRPALVALAASAAFAMALLFKENAITILGVVLVADLCRLDRMGGAAAPARAARVSDGHKTGSATGSPSWRAWFPARLLRCYLPLLVAAGAVLTVRAAVLHTMARPAAEIAAVDNVIAQPTYGLAEGESPFLARWGTPLAVFGKAAGLLLHPDPLCWDYSWAAIDSVHSLADPRLGWGALWALVVLAGIAVSLARGRLVAFALGFMVMTWSVTSNFFVVIGTIFAERYLYLPSAGFCVLVGLLAAAAARRVRTAGGWAVRAAAALVLLGLGAGLVWFTGLTIRRNHDFVSEANLNRVDLATNPRSCRLLSAVAGDHYAAGDFDAAADYAARAIQICPELTPAWQLAGLAHWRSGRAREALPRLERAVRLGAVASEQVAVAIADIHRAAGDSRTAIDVLERFIRQDTARTAAAARNNLAWYLITAQPAEDRDPARALPMARQAVEIERGQPDYVDTLVSVLVALGRSDQAISTLEELLPTVADSDPGRQGLVEKLAALERERSAQRSARGSDETVPRDQP